MLALAQDMGTLHLALRSAQDEATADVSAVTVKELLRTVDTAPQEHEVAKMVAVPEDVPAEPKPPSQIAVRTLRGAMRSTMVMRASAASAACIWKAIRSTKERRLYRRLREGSTQ